MYYPELLEAAEIIGLLLGSGAIACWAGQYGSTLNTTNPPELRRMFYMSLANFSFVIYTRVLHFPYTLYKTLRFFWNEENAMLFFVGACVGALGLVAFNLLVTIDNFKRVKKYYNLHFGLA